jgi:hypothetical protein
MCRCTRVDLHSGCTISSPAQRRAREFYACSWGHALLQEDRSPRGQAGNRIAETYGSGVCGGAAGAELHRGKSVVLQHYAHDGGGQLRHNNWHRRPTLSEAEGTARPADRRQARPRERDRGEPNWYRRGYCRYWSPDMRTMLGVGACAANC